VVAVGEILNKGRARATPAHLLWLSAWLLVAGGLLAGAWWLRQGPAVRLAADSYAAVLPNWGLRDWTWHVCGAGIIGAVALGVVHVLPHVVRDQRAGDPGPGPGHLVSPLVRADLQRIVHALAVLGFIVSVCHWTRLTLLTLAVTAVWTLVVGLLRRRGRPPGRSQEAH
jgi:hypothetical protein